MCINKISSNAPQNYTKKEGSDFSPYKSINVLEFANSFLSSKKEIIENELQRVWAMVSAKNAQAVEISESLDNIERQYCRAVSAAFCYEFIDAGDKIASEITKDILPSASNIEEYKRTFSNLRTTIELEIDKAQIYLSKCNNTNAAEPFTGLIKRVKSSLFDEIHKAALSNFGEVRSGELGVRS